MISQFSSDTIASADWEGTLALTLVTFLIFTRLWRGFDCEKDLYLYRNLKERACFDFGSFEFGAKFKNVPLFTDPDTIEGFCPIHAVCIQFRLSAKFHEEAAQTRDHAHNFSQC